MEEIHVETASILLVEDDPDDALLTKRAFEKARVWNRIDVAVSADDAWKYLTHQAPYEDDKRYPLPVVLVIDLNMPGMDGRELLAKIREQDAFKDLHIVVSSNSDYEKDMELVRSLGASQYVIKPMQKSSVLQIIGKLKSNHVILGNVLRSGT